mmetsp:Transcript_17259/g.43012  ORF Transcript_17259/g.43012 Transcript_17259/m.43012 type:complete len:99 (-) Transcript_17259:307-603(-)
MVRIGSMLGKPFNNWRATTPRCLLQGCNTPIVLSVNRTPIFHKKFYNLKMTIGSSRVEASSARDRQLATLCTVLHQNLAKSQVSSHCCHMEWKPAVNF